MLAGLLAGAGLVEPEESEDEVLAGAGVLAGVSVAVVLLRLSVR